jgi:ubiquinone/menaquinone biosynthesis C-methylase UbiE
MPPAEGPNPGRYGDAHETAPRPSGLRLAPGSTVLDVACGPGSFTSAYAETVGPTGTAIGLDLSRPMLDRAMSDHAGTGSSYLLGSAHQLPFAARWPATARST